MKPIYTTLVLLFIIKTAFSQTSYYVNDNSTSGDVLTTAVGNNANAGTAASPFASLQYAVNLAAADDIIYVDAGSYAEQVIINKGITIIGAGQNLTFFTPPASTLVPAPGPFTEIGLFVTTQNIGDVNISNLTINSNSGSQNIIIQSGGSVKNCILLNGGQGVFFRVESAVKNALIENNTIQPDGIGINCQGGGLTVTIRSNIISKATGYYAGIFAGLDFGPLPQLTIQNNIVNNYTGEGLLVNSFNGSYTSNSITGTSTFAINRSGGNTPLATCNWFGTSNAGTVASKINGFVVYSPFLTNGTDNSSNPGFQPAGTCGNAYYVNDASTAGDIFTTAVGNNANAGTAAAPFATLQYAVNTASANDIIYVDAGTYTEQVTITKGISIFGAGQNATSILKPAVVVAPPAGPSAFSESGVIQTAQNIGEVNIKDLSVTGDYNVGVTPIIIQSSGSLRNCQLQSGNQGLFVRIDAATNPGAKTFYIEGNIIQAEYIAVNVEGTALHAILSNNTISAYNAGFSVGIFAGLDFGAIGRITATNNLFSSYLTSGIWVNAFNASITQNAFTGAGSSAINRLGGASITANCNWYGAANASSIVPKINAGVNYSPWYIDGTDLSPATGFQHWTESCGGSTNIYYVNDNSTTGDIFTTTTGNDANAGTSPTSPLATFGAALTKASPGATIYMDAGTYTAQDLTINKSVSVIGTNYHVSPNSTSDPLLLNSTRNSESIIDNTNWILGASDLRFEGLTFNSTSKQAITMMNDIFANHNFYRNRFRISSNATQIFIAGSGPATMAPSAIVNWGFGLTDNRFEKQDGSAGQTLDISRFGSVNITNNSFVVTGPTPRTQSVLNIGGNGVVNYVYIGQNTFDQAATAISGAGSRLAVVNMNYNKIINSSNAFSAGNLLAESSEVAFRYNTLDGSGGVVPFIEYTRQAGDASGSSSSFTAEENIITGTAIAGTTTLLSSMHLIFANSVLNQSLTVRNNKITYNGDFSTVEGQFIRPIMMRGNLKNAVVEKNEISLSGNNLQPRNPTVNLPVCPAITLYTENGSGAFLQPGSVINILNNKVNGFKHSFAAFDPGAGNDVFIGYGNIPAGVTVNINNNSFTGDSISINNGTVGQPVLATCNWYVSGDAALVVPKISGIATYSPWLSNGTDNSVATGFQPLSNVCNGRQNKFYVNDVSQTGDVFTTAVGNDANTGIPSAPLLTIAAALTKASAGDSIFMDAGTYVLSADLTIGKAVTILGTNYLLSPNDVNDKRVLNAVRNAESIVSNATLIIGSNDISIQGMVLDPGTGAIAVFLGSGTNYSNISLAKNRLKMNSLSPAVRFEGQGTNTVAVSALVNSGFTINDNRFEKYDAGQSLAINISRLKNVTVTNNAFVVGGSTLRNYTAIAMGNVGVIDAITFSSNTIDRALNVITGSRIGNAVLNGNKIYNTTNGFNISNTIPESSIIEFSNNLLDGSAGVSPFSFYTRSGGGNAGASSLFKAENNIVTAVAVPGTTTLLGTFNATFTNTVLNPSMIIRGNKITYSGNLSTVEGQFIRPIVIRGKLTNATVENNELTLSGTNLQARNPANVLPVCPAISLYSDNGSGSVIPTGSVINILNNKIDGFKYSFVVFDPINAAGTGDAFTGFGNLGPNIAVNVHENSFTGDSMSINNGSVGYPIDASCNWYGSSALQNLVGKFSTELDNVYLPYLTNGTDNDIATGFQPVAGSCNGQPIQARLDGFTNVTCNGLNNGTASVTVFNGVAPFVFAWTKDGDPLFSSNVEDPANFGPGTYHLLITDALGTNIILDANTDITTINVTITEPPVLTATASGTNVNCFNGTNGTASVTAGGGTPGYTYSWSNGATTSSISNLAAGIYNVTVTDGNGCTKLASYEVTQPALLTATGSGTNVSCFGGSNGTATVTVGGGTSPFTYAWSNGGTTQSIPGLGIGTYNIIVTDAKGCTAQSSYQVTQPTLLTAVATGTSTTCANSATVVPNGGTAPYTYLWSNGATTQAISSLPAGTYTVTVTDNKGCIVTASCTVTATEAFNPSASVVNASCYNTATGSITVTNVNATAPFRFSIDGVNFSAPQALPYTFNNLAVGAYTITVRDANGCTGFVEKTITQPTQLNITLNNVQSTCFGTNTGSVNVSVSGGSPSYSYLWNGPGGYTSTQLNISNLASGQYTLTVTDSKGCPKVLQAIVPSYNEVIVSAVVTNVACKSDASGSIVISASGGDGSLNHKWSTGATTAGIFNLPAGTYRDTITNSGSGCIIIKTYTITQPSSLLKLNNPTITDVSGCDIANLGSISASATGGGSSYQFKLNNGSYQPSGTFNALNAGSYTVWVKDNLGCEKSTIAIVGDNGSDAYEGTGGNKNNSKTKAFAIPLGSISARIPTTADPADWYKFTANIAGSYTLSLSHPSASFTINLYTLDSTNSINTQSGSIALNKLYYLLANKTYYIQVTGGPSPTCYQLSINNTLLTRMSSELIVKENKTFVDKLSTSVFPNPHHGAFGIRIESAQDGAAVLEILNAAGQLVAEKRTTVNKGGVSIVNFTNMNHNILFYRVRIGDEISTGKIIGPH